MTAENNVRIGRLDRPDPDARRLDDGGPRLRRRRRGGRAARPAGRPCCPGSSRPGATCPAGSGSGWRWPVGCTGTPPLVIADEPTAALDARAEQAVFATLRGARTLGARGPDADHRAGHAPAGQRALRRPDRRAGTRPGHRARPARRADGAAAAPTTSCSRCRRAPTPTIRIRSADDRAGAPRRRRRGRHHHPGLPGQPQRAVRAAAPRAARPPGRGDRGPGRPGDRADPHRAGVLLGDGPQGVPRGRARRTRGSPSSRRSWSGSGPRRPRCWPGSAGPARAGGVGLVAACDIAVRRRGRHLRVQRGADRGGAGGHLGGRAAAAAAPRPRTSCSSPGRPSTPTRRPGSG